MRSCGPLRGAASTGPNTFVTAKFRRSSRNGHAKAARMGFLEPDGHTKRTTAQAVIGKVMSLCMMAGIIGSIYAFGELTVGTGACL